MFIQLYILELEASNSGTESWTDVHTLAVLNASSNIVYSIIMHLY